MQLIGCLRRYVALMVAGVIAGAVTATTGATAASGAPRLATLPAQTRVGPFSSLVTALSQGPQSNDLALTFRDGSVEALVGGKPGLSLPPEPLTLPPAQWIPGTSWIVYARVIAGGSPCGASIAYYLAPAAGGTPTPMPTCGNTAVGPTGVQVLPDAVAWLAQTLMLLKIPRDGAAPNIAQASHHLLGGTQPAPTLGSVVADATMQHVAVREQNDIRPLWMTPMHGPYAGDSQGDTYGTFLIDPSHTQMVWSSDGVLAMSNAEGVYLWNAPGPGHYSPLPWVLRHFAQATRVDHMQWEPDGSAVLVLDLVSRSPKGKDYAVYRFGTDESTTLLARGRLGYVLGFGPNGGALWREEGVLSGVYGGHPGPGPFYLREVPLRAPSGPPRAVPLPGPGISSASPGPDEDDVAAMISGDSCVVAQQWRGPLTIPDCDWIEWVPDSQWIVYQTITTASDGGVQRLGVVARDLTSGVSVAVPCPATDIQAVTAYPGPNVAYACGTETAILHLGSSNPQPFALTKLPPVGGISGSLEGIAVDTTGRFIALTTQFDYDLEIFRLPQQTRVPGAFLAGGPIALAWSARDTLAIATGNGLALWQPNGALHMLHSVINTDVLRWSTDGSQLLAYSAYDPNPGAWRIDVRGGSTRLEPRSHNAVVALTADGKYQWEEACRGGLFSLACELVPVPVPMG